MSYETIQISIKDKIGVVTLNRPPMNPLSSRVFEDLAGAADELQADNSVKVIIITGAGNKAFAAGADVAEMAALSPVEAYKFCQGSKIAFSKLQNLSKPVIAAVNGIAFGGGCELALSCDFRIAADRAEFAFPETGLGIIPGGGGTQRLPRLIGASRAKELMYLGEILDAGLAEKIGLINRVVPSDSLMEEAVIIAQKLAAKPLVALQMAKAAINAGENVDINSGLDIEILNFVTAFASSDGREGLSAFIEKRKPNYIDK